MDTIFSHPLALLVIVGLPLFGIIARMLKMSFAKIAKIYLCIALFAIIIVMDSVFFPFIGGKDWFFRYAIELALAAFALWWAFEAADGEFSAIVKSTFRNPLVIAVSAFVVAYLLAGIFANDAMAAFWSNYERGEGVFQMLHYYAFFVLLVALVRTEREWKRLFGYSLIAACLMVGYGILGNYGAATFIGPYAGATLPSGWFQELIVGRFQGSLGNPAYVAPYLMFAMFFALYLWSANRAESSFKTWRNWGYGILVLVFLFFFILSQTRGAFIGLGAGIFVFLLYLAFSKSATLRKWSVTFILVMVVLGGISYGVRNLPAVENLPEGRLLQLSLSDSTAQTRFWVWGEAWQGFLERPIFGWGPENFTAVYDKFFNPNFYIPGQNTETWFDRAHSVFFDYLSEDGIIGLAAYLSIFITFYVVFLKRRKKESDAEKRNSTLIIEQALIFSMPVAYLVQGIAIFDVLPMYISLFFFLAFAAWHGSKSNTKIQNMKN